MGITLKRRLYESIRCIRHNLVHLSMFRLSFDGQYWRVRDRDGLDMRFPFYPYTAFLEIEGYLRHGRWKLEPGMTVVDAGGCYGEYALYAAKKVGAQGRVLMLEPDLENLKIAEEVFALNGSPSCMRVDTTGLWKSAGQLSFAQGLAGASQLVESSDAVPPGATMTHIKVETLMTMAQKHDFARMDMVKIDIEGAELEVISAAKDAIERFKPRFAIASYHLRDGKMTSETLEQMFRDFGYAVETGFDTHRTTWAGVTI